MAELSYGDAVVVGLAQSTALIAGISRDGVCMTAGLARGLSQETAARFAFLLATPVILAAGVFKLPDFLGATGAGRAGAGAARARVRSHGCDRFGALAGALVQDPQPDAVRHLLRGVRPGHDHLLQRLLATGHLPSR